MTPVVWSSYSVTSMPSRLRRNDSDPPTSSDVVISGLNPALAATVAAESAAGMKTLLSSSGDTSFPVRDQPACTIAEFRLSP